MHRNFDYSRSPLIYSQKTKKQVSELYMVFCALSSAVAMLVPKSVGCGRRMIADGRVECSVIVLKF